MFAIDARFNVESFADLRAKRPAFRLSTAWDDGVNMTGFAAYRMLEASDVSPAAIGSWGGELLLGEAPWDTIPLVTAGKADAVLFEAIMTPYWRDLCASKKITSCHSKTRLSRLSKRNLSGSVLRFLPAGSRSLRVVSSA